MAESENRSYTVLASVLLGALLLVVALLLWRMRGPGEQRAEDTGGGVITEQSGVDTVEGGVAVWVKPGENVKSVLVRNGLADAAYTDLGEGTYVVSVGDADPDTVIERLKQDEGLYDAGYIYAEDVP